MHTEKYIYIHTDIKRILVQNAIFVSDTNGVGDADGVQFAGI